MKQMWLKFKRRWIPYIIAYCVKGAVNLLMRTCRVSISGLDNFTSVARQSPCILMLWHNRMVALPHALYNNARQFNYTAFISKSRDGDPLALIVESYKMGHALRVPHNARHKALGQMINQLDKAGEIMMITPDGPRGPRYEVKPGIVLAARESAAKIVPFSWDADRVWTLKTWDGMMIPKPFSKVKVTFGSPIALGKDEEMDVERETEKLRLALFSIVK